MVASEQRPLVVCCQHGTIRDLVLSNEKVYAKSIENGRLWVVHPETGRELPYEHDVELIGLQVHERWYEAVVTCDHPNEPRASEDDAAGDASSWPVPPASGGSENSAEVGSDQSWGEILKGLAGVVAARRRELPEGSYTTHLFASGVDKIRKKTGEEAVELILAREPSEVVHEAADLVYHMLVLFEALEIDPAELFRELDRRR